MTRPLPTTLVILCALATASLAAACVRAPVPTTVPGIPPAATTTPAPSATTRPPTATLAPTPTLPTPTREQPSPEVSSTPVAPAASATATPAATLTATLPPPTTTPFVVLNVPPAQPIPPAADALDPASATHLRLVAELGQGRIGGLAWSPGGRYLAVSAGGRVMLYDAATYNLATALTTGPGAGLVAFNSSGDRLAVVRVNGTVPDPLDPNALPRSGDAIQVWDWSAGQKTSEFGLALPDQPDARWRVEQLAFGADTVAANLIDSLNFNETRRITAAWSLNDGRLLFTLPHENQYTHSTLEFSPDGQTLLVPAGFGIQVRAARTGDILAEYQDSGADAVVYAPDGKSFFYVIGDPVYNYTLCQDLPPQENGSPFWHSQWFPGSDDMPITGLVRSGDLIAALSSQCDVSQRLGVWLITDPRTASVDVPLNSRSRLVTLNVPGGSCSNIAIGPDGQRLAFSDGENVLVWDLQSQKLLNTLHMNAVYDAAIGQRKGQYLAAESSSSLILWDLLAGKQLAYRAGGESAAVHPSGAIIAQILETGEIQFWDWARNRVLATMPAPTARPGSPEPLSVYDMGKYYGSPFTFSPDGTRLSRLNLATGQPLAWDDDPTQHYPEVEGQFSGDQHWVTWAETSDPTGKQWMVQRMDWDTRFIREYLLPDSDCCGWLEAANESPDGSRIAVGGQSGKIYIYDAAQPGAPILQFPAHAPQYLYRNHKPNDYGGLRSLRYSSNGRLLLSTGWDQVTRLWDPATGHLLFELPGCYTVSFTPDGRYLVTQASGVVWAWGE